MKVMKIDSFRDILKYIFTEAGFIPTRWCYVNYRFMFAMLAGIVVNNAIVLVDYINRLKRRGMDRVEAVVTAVDHDPKVRVMIVTGAGRGFSAGLDLQSQGRAPGSEGVQPTVAAFMWQDHLATLHEKIHRSRKPWIAAVNGVAVGSRCRWPATSDLLRRVRRSGRCSSRSACRTATWAPATSSPASSERRARRS